MPVVLRQFRTFVMGVITRMTDGHFGLVAAGVAFYAMFSVFPAIGAVVAIWGMIADPIVIEGYLDFVEKFLPGGADRLIHEQVIRLVTAPRSTLGWASLLSILIALFSARAGVAALIQGLDVVHQVERRGLVAGYAREFLLTIALIGALVGALATAVTVPLILAYLPFGSVLMSVLRFLPWVVMFLLVLTCLGILFRYGPNLPPGTRWGWSSVGVLFSALAWAGVSLAFSIYLENFNSYNRIYGSIGAAIILMMWLYLSVWAILAGGAINAELDARARLRRQMGKGR